MIKRPLRIVCVLSILCVCHAFAADPPAASRQVRTVNGVVEGGAGAYGSVRFFGGIPYAAPPVGELRWKAPQPAADWAGVRKATAFGPHCLQAHPSFGLVFVDRGENEDCLFVNVWTPAKSATQKLPVLVWIHGGAFTDGASSEARYDGEHLAKKGIVVVSLNYRLGVFGLFAHPELTKESDAHASGNQGLLDQVAALRWVAANIAAFGGDPGNVTIAGESAGSQSVSALMVAPIAQPYFQKAIGESGALFHTIDNEYVPHPLADAEAAGAKFAKSIDAPSLAALRAMPADALSQAAANSSSFKPAVDIDGDLVKASVVKVFADGAQAHVPLLAGWNADEGTLLTLPAKGKLTLGGYKV